MSSQDVATGIMRAALRVWLLRKLLERHAREYSERHGLPIKERREDG